MEFNSIFFFFQGKHLSSETFLFKFRNTFLNIKSFETCLNEINKINFQRKILCKNLEI